MELKGKKIAILGDSITQGIGVEKEENYFCNLLAKWGECTVYNHGIGGTRIARRTEPHNPDFDKNDFCTRIDRLEDDADIIMVFGGTNDYGHGDAPLGTFDSRDTYTFYGACHYIMTRIHERYPGKQAVIMTPIHRHNEFAPDHNGEPLITYVRIIREVAEYYSIPVLDLYAVSGIQPQLDIILERYIPDGLHPNDAGHEILARKMFSFLKNL